MTTTEKFMMKSDIERVALNSIIPLLFKDKDYQHYTTNSQSFDIYDAYVMLFNDEKPMSRFMLEIKVRDRHYNELMLEKKKYEDLKKQASQSGASVIYISVTPVGTYCYNLSKIINDNTEWIKEEHWVSTTDKTKGKKMKSLVYIPTTESKMLPYNSSIAYRTYDDETNKVKMKEESKCMKKQFCLFKDIFNKE